MHGLPPGLERASTYYTVSGMLIGVSANHPPQPSIRHWVLTEFRIGPALTILAVVIFYLASLTRGHAFIGDDFAAYVMHAENIAVGRAYSDIRYVPNPTAVGFAPAQGYPPVYPLLLAPAYKIWGLDLLPMKVVTVVCFGISLAALVLLFSSVLSAWALSALVAITGFNIVFWSQHDYLLSESAYLMFSFGTLLAAQKIYSDLEPNEWRLRSALILSLLLYATYGTRTVGVVLLPALVLADLCKFRRPSRFLIVVVTFSVGLILLQNTLLLSPKAYLNAEHISAPMIREHVVFYGKTLSYVWRNGFSKLLQIFMALAFTTLASMALGRNFWTTKSIVGFYLLGYAAVLTVWTTEIGMRGLIPMLPLYFAFGIEGLAAFGKRFNPPTPRSLIALSLALIGVAYLGAYHWKTQQPHLGDVQDPEAQQLFSYLRNNTRPGDLLVFQKPRTLALFTNRSTTMLAPGEPAAAAQSFFAAVNAKFLVQNRATSYPIQEFIADGILAGSPVFDNGVFQVYAITARP
jgi:hypothetical protein